MKHLEDIIESPFDECLVNTINDNMRTSEFQVDIVSEIVEDDNFDRLYELLDNSDDIMFIYADDVTNILINKGIDLDNYEEKYTNLLLLQLAITKRCEDFLDYLTE